MSDQSRRILIVDDEENVCHALRRSLRKEGYQLFFGHEPAEGLAVLKDQPIDFEALLKGLLCWKDDEKRTQNAWARDFYRSIDTETEGQPATLEEVAP